MADPIRELPPPATEQDWAALHSFGGAFGGPAKRCLFELRDRLAAVEARLAQAQAVATGRPLVLPDECFQAMEAAAAQVAPTTTADGLSPVEPAPQAPQGVTVHALVRVLSHATADAAGAAYVLWDHPRIGPLLRGEGAPVQSPVVLPEEPNSGPALYELNRTRDRGCFLAGWLAYRAEVARLQGGQADG